MAYRTDDALESSLPVTKLLTQEQRSFDATATLPNNRIGQRLVSYLDRQLSRSKKYRAPLSERWTLLVIGDSLCLLLSIWAAYLMAPPDQSLVNVLWGWAPILLVCWWGLASLNDIYDIPSSWDLQTSGARVARGAVLSLAIGCSVSYLSPNLLPVRFLFFFWLAFVALIIAWRFAYTRLSQLLFSPHRILLVGLESQAQSIMQLLRPAGHLNYQILGFVDDLTESKRGDLPRLGQVADLPRLVDSLGIHEVVVDTQRGSPAELVNALITLQGQGVRVSWLADLYEKFRRSIPVQEIEPLWALYAIQGQPIFDRLQLVMKRCLDLCIAILALPTLLLFMPIIALCIRLDSRGPIFYRQVRVGRGSALFAIYKFRTMQPNAEAAGVPKWAQENDPRITRVGRILRKTRLDELPQILNILRGDMSFVGPRPERPEFVQQLEQTIPLYRTRLLVKPGLTGWAQIHYGYGNSQEDALRKLQYDFYYVRHWSLWRDIYVLFQTVAVVIQCKGT